MNKHMKTILMVGVLAVVCTAGIVFAEDAEPQDKLDFMLGGEFVISPGYNDYTDEAYPGYDSVGGYGWIGLLLGLEYKVTPQISVIGSCDLWFNSVEVTGGALDESYLNVIVLPAIYAQYYFTQSRSFYVNAGINLPLPSTGSDYYEFSGNGVGFGGNLGFAFGYNKNMRFEAGYVIVPVEAEATPSNPVLSGTEDYNFGGFQARFIFAF